MKELSIEEKARRYDEAIERLEDIKTGKCPKTFIFTKGLFDYIFPEPKESEDEKIRKSLMQNLKERFGTKGNMGEGLDMPDVLAWLEKQGEQKPQGKTALEAINEEKVDNANKVEPRQEEFTDFERTLADICIGWIGEEPGWEQYIKDNADVLLKNAIKMFNSVQDADFEQEPAEDPVWYDNMDDLIADGMIDEIQKSNLPKGSKHNRIYWINKHRAQPKQEWNKEDEERIKNIISVLDVQVCWDGATGKKRNPYQKEIDWLKSLRPQNTCKPFPKIPPVAIVEKHDPAWVFEQLSKHTDMLIQREMDRLCVPLRTIYIGASGNIMLTRFKKNIKKGKRNE